MKSDLDNTLSKNILKLISGEGIGRGIGFMTAPFITRLYTPSDFGILAVFASLCVLCYPFCTLRYTLAIPLHSNEKIGINSLAACLLILVINTIILYSLALTVQCTLSIILVFHILRRTV